MEFAFGEGAGIRELRLLKDRELYNSFRDVLTVLDPIDEQLQIAEDHGYTLGRVYKSWKYIEEHLNTIKRTDNQFASAVEDYLERPIEDSVRSWAKRKGKQLLPLHITAYYVDPGNLQESFPGDAREEVSRFLDQHLDDLNARTVAEGQFNEFRHRRGPFAGHKYIWKTWETSSKDIGAVKQFWMSAVSPSTLR
jgi:hypothetical protein